MCGFAAVGLVLTAVSAAVSFVGQQQQAKAAKGEARYKQAILKNNQIAKQQDIQAETKTERIRQQLISREGGVREGEIRTAQAGLGQLVDTGSAADLTEELAGEVAFKKLVSQHESELRKRNLQIEADNIQGDIGLVGFQGAQAASSAKTAAFGTLLSTGTTLVSKFRFGDGRVSFAT